MLAVVDLVSITRVFPERLKCAATWTALVVLAIRSCPECSKKKLPLGALIVHLNDAHHWTRERIAAWVADPDVPQDESHAHH